jgi:hypothetical protein
MSAKTQLSSLDWRNIKNWKSQKRFLIRQSTPSETTFSYFVKLTVNELRKYAKYPRITTQRLQPRPYPS